MKKFGFSRKSDKAAGSASDNPYAQQAPAEDPYSNARQPMNQGSMAPRPGAGGLPTGPRAGLPSGPRGGGGFGGPPAPRPAPPQQSNSYGSQGDQRGQGFGSDRYGSGGGYGGTRYDNGNVQSQSSSGSSRTGGYGGMAKSDSDSYDGRKNYSQDQQSSYGSSNGPGGRYGKGNGSTGTLGRTTSSSTEVNRGDLFGGAQNRYNPDRGNNYKETPPQDDQQYGRGKSALSAVDSGSYGGYGEQRELTQEEREEQQYQGTKSEIGEVRDESLQSTNRTLQLMYQSVETARSTIGQLGSQGERLQNAERNMDLADNYNAVGLDKTKELQTVNRSMFSVHVANPFTAKKRAAARDQEVMDRHRMEKDQREETRRAHYEEAQTVEQSFRKMDINQQQAPSYRVPRKQNKYVLTDEESDADDKEEAINRNLGDMSMVAGTLKSLASETGVILDQQNRVIDRIASKTDRVDDGVRRNRNELDKIR